MTKLKINLLGPPEILWENERLNIYGRIPRTLLYFLASQNNLVGRGKLLSIFRADTTPQIGRRRLREAFSKIRAKIPVSNFITIDNDLVGLDQSNLSVDLKGSIELQDVISNRPWVVASDQVFPEETLQSLKSGVNLYRGTQFLEGTELPNSSILDDWRYQTNLNLTQLRIRLLTRLSDHYIAL